MPAAPQRPSIRRMVDNITAFEAVAFASDSEAGGCGMWLSKPPLEEKSLVTPAGVEPHYRWDAYGSGPRLLASNLVSITHQHDQGFGGV
jgi:hypothetical protein